MCRPVYSYHIYFVFMQMKFYNIFYHKIYNFWLMIYSISLCVMPIYANIIYKVSLVYYQLWQYRHTPKCVFLLLYAQLQVLQLIVAITFNYFKWDENAITISMYAPILVLDYHRMCFNASMTCWSAFLNLFTQEPLK